MRGPSNLQWSSTVLTEGLLWRAPTRTVGPGSLQVHFFVSLTVSVTDRGPTLFSIASEGTSSDSENSVVSM